MDTESDGESERKREGLVSVCLSVSLKIVIQLWFPKHMFKSWNLQSKYPRWIWDLCSFWVLRLLQTQPAAKLAVSSGSVEMMPRGLYLS